MLNHGAQPFFVDVLNKGVEECDVALTFTLNSSYATCTLQRTVRVAAGGHTAFEVCAPVDASGSAPYTLMIRCGSDSQYVPGVGASLPAAHGVRNVLLLSASPLDPGLPATWSKRLSLAAPTEWGNPPADVPFRVRGMVMVRPPRSVSPTTTDLVNVTAIAFADLPRNAASYSSIDAVVIDTSAGLPGPDALAAIGAFARSGGVVVVVGGNARESARGAPDLAPWIEPRFLVDDGSDSADSYVAGLGLLVVAPMAFLSLESLDAILVKLLSEQDGNVSCIPRIGGGRNHDLDVTLPGLELPYRALMLVLFLFAIVIGPLNLWFVKRSKKPVLLLFTVPAIAIVFSLALFAYGALAQGLDVRARAVTLTLLDQRTHHSTALETREIFAGLSPGKGLRPGPGAWMYWNPSSGSWDDRKRYTIDFGDGVEFSGDYLPARTPTRQTSITDRAARQRVELLREGDGWTARFGLGAGVNLFVFRAPDGRLWQAPRATPDGGSVELEPAVEAGDVGHVGAGMDAIEHPDVHDVFAALVRDQAQGLPLGTYAAVLESSPFTDSMGVEARDVDSAHLLVGIVDLAEVNR
jgi:hypothetical protein